MLQTVQWTWTSAPTPHYLNCFIPNHPITSAFSPGRSLTLMYRVISWSIRSKTKDKRILSDGCLNCDCSSCHQTASLSPTELFIIFTVLMPSKSLKSPNILASLFPWWAAEKMQSRRGEPRRRRDTLTTLSPRNWKLKSFYGNFWKVIHR